MKKKVLWTIIIIVIILIIIGAAAFYFLNKQGISFGFANFDFSGGLENLGKTGNAFENAKLNPFSNSTG